MNINKILGLCTAISTIFVSKAYAVTLRTLKWNTYWSNLIKNRTQIEWWRSVFDIIRFVNSYLWFAIWFVCFLFMVFNGYKLITAHWDEKQTQAATKGLMWSIVWIAVCLLAYIIVNVAVKLFA